MATRRGAEVVAMVATKPRSDLIVQKEKEKKQKNKKKTMRENFKEELLSCLATRLSGRTALSLSLPIYPSVSSLSLSAKPLSVFFITLYVCFHLSPSLLQPSQALSLLSLFYHSIARLLFPSLSQSLSLSFSPSSPHSSKVALSLAPPIFPSLTLCQHHVMENM